MNKMNKISVESIFNNRAFRTVAVGSSALVFAGCSAIRTNDDIGECTPELSTPIEATFRPKEAGYEPSTDPSVLAEELLRQTQAEIEEREDSGSFTISNHVVGLREVVCRSRDEPGEFYLTPEGAKLSQELRSSSSEQE